MMTETLRAIGESPRHERGRAHGRVSIDLVPGDGETERWALFLEDGTLLAIRVLRRTFLECAGYRGYGISSVETVFLTAQARGLS